MPRPIYVPTIANPDAALREPVPGRTRRWVLEGPHRDWAERGPVLQVRLTGPTGERFVGCASVDSSVESQLRAGAAATVAALRKGLAPRVARVELVEISAMDAAGLHSAAAVVQVEYHGYPFVLLGFAPLAGDPGHSGAAAVMHATGRLLVEPDSVTGA